MGFDFSIEAKCFFGNDTKKKNLGTFKHDRWERSELCSLPLVSKVTLKHHFFREESGSGSLPKFNVLFLKVKEDCKRLQYDIKCVKLKCFMKFF